MSDDYFNFREQKEAGQQDQQEQLEQLEQQEQSESLEVTFKRKLRDHLGFKGDSFDMEDFKNRVEARLNKLNDIPSNL